MQIKVFSIPTMGGERLNEEMNAFLRSKKVIEIEQQLVGGSHSAHWSFCIKYVEDYSPFNKSREKVDYKQVLDEDSFARFSHFREIRRRLHKQENVPAYAIFTDEELAGFAKLPELTLAAMMEIKGVGEGKVEKYGRFFIEKKANEESQPPA